MNKYIPKIEMHGESHTRLWNIWNGMIQRCYNNNHTAYKYYGKKGIKLCDIWKSFLTFKAWALYNGYENNLTIDRKNSNLNYCPDNCHWITQIENIKRMTKEKTKW